jgi:predicted aldo/keto reductase-like oxidoreductase
MKYRRFGKLDWEASALGFGTMRLPYLDGYASKIDEPLAVDMIRYAVDHGVNYVDTAYSYAHKEAPQGR